MCQPEITLVSRLQSMTNTGLQDNIRLLNDVLQVALSELEGRIGEDEYAQFCDTLVEDDDSQPDLFKAAA